MITTLESTTPLREGVASSPRQAWIVAIDAALDELTATTPDGCAIVIDGTTGLLVPGRAEDGRLDLPGIRWTAERMAIASLG